MRPLAAVLALLSLAAIVPQARADVATRTRHFDAKGRAAYARGRYGDALRYFLRVNEQTPGPLAAYNVAVSADLAGEPELCLAHLAEYLAGDDADPDRRKGAAELMAKLRAGLAPTRLAH
ncbi:MAG: hypothetical protein HY744_23210 [Deltaproteobacteria bacterium]|nr:hypothetical protein [Deltaproteobacteria bacterium]